MEDQIVSSSDENGGESSNFLKYALLTLGGILALVLVGGGSYMLGARTARIETQSTTTESVARLPTARPNTLGIETDLENDETASISASPSANSRISPTPTPLSKSKILPSTAKLDGYRVSTGSGSLNSEIRAGRNSSAVTRGFVTFDLKSLPAGAKVVSATLRMYQTKIVGNPYIAGGGLKLDHLTYGDALDSTDYSLAALLNQFAILGKTPKLEWKEVDVTQAVKNDVANARSSSQFRIRFMTEVAGGTEMGDFVYFESAEDSQKTGNVPQLLVKYY